MLAHQFGFLKSPVEFTLKCLSVRPLDGHPELVREVVALADREGNLYPPLDELPAGSGLGRSLPVYRQWASHVLEIDATDETAGRVRAAFVVQLLAFLHGTRLQFADRWMEGRVPLLRDTNDFGLSQGQVASVVSDALRAWEALDDEGRTALTNLLYLHSKAPAYEWDWEAFALEYWVTDALYRHAVRCHGSPSAPRHADRIAVLCRHFGLSQNAQAIGTIVRLRNDLMHEALWDGQLPGSQASDESYRAAKLLRGLNSRLICAMLGRCNQYVASDWTLWVRFAFD